MKTSIFHCLLLTILLATNVCGQESQNANLEAYPPLGDLIPVTEGSNQSMQVSANIDSEQDAVAIPDFHLKARNASDVSLDKPKKSHPSVNYDIYRDISKYPVDPRKPCNDCVRPPSKGPFTRIDAKAFLGRPLMEKEPGGCLCGKKRCKCNRRLTYLYWPRPFSAKLDEKFPRKAIQRYSECQRARLVDVFDKFEDFKLIPYTRTDNGHQGNFFGRNREVYGCLGESRQFGGVRGVNFRLPGVPIQRGLNMDSSYEVPPTASAAQPTNVPSMPVSHRMPTPVNDSPRNGVSEWQDYKSSAQPRYVPAYPLDMPEPKPNRLFRPQETYEPANSERKQAPQKRIGVNSANF